MAGKWQKIHEDWQRFKSEQNNSLDVVSKMNKNGSTTFGLDWARAVSPVKDKIFINGKGLSAYAKEYDFYSKDQTVAEVNPKVKQFFLDVLLKDVVASPEEKQKMVDYLGSIFHQGGLMNPGSTGVSVALSQSGISVDTGLLDTRLDITTTTKGIKVQELCAINQLLVPDDATRKKLNLVESPVILPDKNKNFVMQTTVALDVNFAASPSSPSITIEKNRIEYGNEQIKKAIPERNIFKALFEFIVQLFKSSPVQVGPATPIKSVEPIPTSVVAVEEKEANSLKL